MRILVIGATGFIGPHVVAALARDGHSVIAFHRGGSLAALPEGVERIAGDRRNLGACAERLQHLAPDVVIDLILSSGAQASLLMQTFRGIARRVVAASSMDVYRACGVLHRLEPGALEPLPLTEDSVLRTQLRTYPPDQVRMLQQVFGWLDDDYDKIPVERAVLGDTTLPGTVLRLPMIYGPGDRLHRLFPLIKRIDDGRPAILFEEKMAQWRSPRGYVENVAAAIALAAISDRAAGRIYNVAEAEALSELEHARQVAAVSEWKGDFVILPAEGTPAHLLVPSNLDQHWVADSSRIRRELGYREAVPRTEALWQTIEWERRHPPESIDARQFDYAAEDAALSAL